MIDVKMVTSANVSASPTDIYDEIATGLEVVGKGTKVYLEALPADASLVGGYSWELTSKPSGSSTLLNATTGTVVTLRPDLKGEYLITLTPLNLAMADTTSTQQVIRASTFAGVGEFNTHSTPSAVAPNCDTGFCHGGGNARPELGVAPKWAQSLHANKLQNHMNGVYGDHYSTSCLQCHTVGFDTAPLAVNGGFDDIASSISYNLALIPALVADAALNNKQNFTQLPAVLQAKASIQCENCHGPGTDHPANLSESGHGIAGVNLKAKTCVQCHNGTHQGNEYNISNHQNAAEAAHSASCVKCHTGEGFVDNRVKGIANPAMPANPSGVTCSTCHDPHYSPE